MKNILLIILSLVSVNLTFGQKLSEVGYAKEFNDNVYIYRLFANGDEIGQSIYMLRYKQRIKTKYFTCAMHGQSAHTRYKRWSQGKRVVLVCAGAYTSDDYTVPIGLTIDNGTIINRLVDQEMDGLMLIEAVGGIRTIDLDAGNSVYLASSGTYVDPRSYSGQNAFKNWAVSERATTFQTNLLVFKNQLKVGDVNEYAERRILAVCTYQRKVVYIVFNIQKSAKLTDMARSIHRLLTGDGYNLVSLVNLDTGMMNIMEMETMTGQKLPFKGTVPISNASNLLVFYYE